MTTPKKKPLTRKTIKTGDITAQTSLKRNRKTVETLQHTDVVEAGLAPFQKIATRTNMPLGMTLTTLPRLGMRLGGTYSEPGTYSSVTVAVWMEEVCPGYSTKAQQRHYDRMLKRLDFVCGNVLEEAKKAWFE